MEKELTKEELTALEKQLGCPSGEMGIEVGKMMNASNIGMTLNSIELLNLQDQHTVLELGHGNCGHLETLLGFAQNIRYYGLEVSKTMHQEAKHINQKLISKKQAEFALYDGGVIPFEGNYFDCIMSVNTIYFWSHPGKLIKEIERVLRPSGCCVLTFADKSFMKELPFVGQNFALYDKGDIQKLMAETNMEVTQFIDKTEQVESKTGEQVNRPYTIVKLVKD